MTAGAFTNQTRNIAEDLDVVLVNGADLLSVCEEAAAWDVVAAYFEELDVVDGDAADVRPPDPRRDDDGSGVVTTLYAAWRTYKRLRRLF